MRTPPERGRQLGRLRRLADHVAFKALAKSAIINLAAPAIVYRLARQLLPGDGILPLALSGAPPALWLIYGVARLKALDILGLFAAENVAVSIAALVLSHTERGALIGRSFQNVILALIFVSSVFLGKPLVRTMARQLATGNAPGPRARFDAEAAKPGAAAAYRVMTLVWALALLIKAAGSYALADHLPARDFLIASPLWDLFSDAVLVSWTLAWGRARLNASEAAHPIGSVVPAVERAKP